MAAKGEKTPGTGKAQNAGKTSKKGAGKSQEAPTSPKKGGKGGKAG